VSEPLPPASGVEPLLDLMRRLRDPNGGCPWDREQTFASLVPYTVEEAYEVADAIERHDMEDLRSELGDLLFQIVFYAQLAEEQRLFDFQQVVAGVCSKMIRRHPHVFGDAHHADAEAQGRHWEQLKAEERAARGETQGPLDDIPRALPALVRAQKLQGRATRLGLAAALDSAAALSRISSLTQALQQSGPTAGPDREQRIGELLFACVALARSCGVDAEAALRQGNEQFRREPHAP